MQVEDGDEDSNGSAAEGPVTPDYRQTGQPVAKTEHAEQERRPKQTPQRPSSPDPTRPASRTTKRLQAEEDEIAALEKKLGLKVNNSRRKANEDGLDDLLGDLDDDGEQSGSKRKRSDDEAWLKSKRARTTGGTSLGLDSEDSDGFEEDDEVFYGDDMHGLRGASDEDIDGLESDASEPPPPPPTTKRKRENPYVAPTTSTESTAKYVPPPRRAATTDDAEIQQRLRRQLQGQINRLSEANLPSIVAEVDKLFSTNPRQYVTSNLIDLLLGLVCDRTALNDTFIVLHAGFIAAIYKVNGQDFGAQLTERAVERFDTYYSSSSSTKTEGTESKELANLVSLFSQLYNFSIISCDLIYDLLRTFLSTLTETHTELLLRIVRSCGSQLRQDDTSSLKDIAMLLQRTIASTPTSQVSVRTRFMIDTITDLKNNKVKAGAASSAVTAEQFSRMKKALGGLNQRRAIRASEPLKLTLEDVRNAEKKGKWWLVGASWRGNDAAAAGQAPKRSNVQQDALLAAGDSEDGAENDGLADEMNTDLYQLARANGMTTPLRRSIFLTLLTSSSYHEAHTRLLKLNLTKSQLLEIPRVMLHCVAREEGYNPYYALVARKLCESGLGGGSRAQVEGSSTSGKAGKKWVFAGMGVVSRLLAGDGAGAESDEEDAGTGRDVMSVAAVVQQAKFFASLIAAQVVGIGMLKPVDWQYLGSKLSIFLEVLVVSVVMAMKRERLPKIFAAALDTPELASGLRRFLKKTVAKSDLAGVEKESERLRKGVKVVLGPECLGGARARPTMSMSDD